MALTRRKAISKVQPIEEIEPVVTVVCPPAEVVVSRARLLCSRCNNNEWSNGLCYEHFKNSQGLMYDEEQNRFVRPRKGKER